MSAAKTMGELRKAKNYRGSLKREVNKHEGLKGREIKIAQNPRIRGRLESIVNKKV